MYLPGTLYRILKERKEIGLDVLKYFYWRRLKRFEIDFEVVYQFTKIAKPYESLPEHRKQIEPYLKVSLPPEVRNILIEELSFLMGKSSLLLRFRRTLHYFKRMGIIIVDLSSTLIEEKEKIFKRIRGLRWFIAVSLGVSDLLPLNPMSSILMRGIGIVLVVFDD